jgi:hypothetical protein
MDPFLGSRRATRMSGVEVASKDTETATPPTTSMRAASAMSISDL